jgi:hypothetical protein
MMLTMGDGGIIVMPVSTGAPLCLILINIGWDFALMLPFIKKFRQRKLKKQIDGFIEWSAKNSPTASLIHKEALEKFIRDTYNREASEITPEHINEYSHSLRTPYAEVIAKRSINMFLLYNKRLIIRPQNAKLILMKNHAGGRRLSIKQIRKVKELRNKLDKQGRRTPFRKISKKMGINISLAHRWAKMSEDRLLKEEMELSTEKQLH